MRKKDHRVGDKHGYKREGKKPKRERERKIKRDSQKRPMRMREKQASSDHYIQLARNYTLHVAKSNFSHSHAYWPWLKTSPKIIEEL